MLKQFSLKPITAILLGISLGLMIAPASLYAANVTDNFELDGNALDIPAGPPDDWSTLVNGSGTTGFITKTPVPVADQNGLPDAVFTGGGSKDILNINQWKWKVGSVPDKDELMNGFAAAYRNASGDLVIYFGADRFDTSGDAQMGFWLFKNKISLNPNGSFNGVHAVGDILILVHFTVGGTQPTIEIFKWVGSGGSDGPLDRLTPAGSFVCGAAGSEDKCAITNAGGETTAWPYVDKNGATTYQKGAFFEGGINVNKVLNTSQAPCFTSFLTETRSSQSVSATLKDFVLAEFPVCSAEISKKCLADGVFNPVTGNIEVPYQITVNATGVNSVIATDNNCGFGSPQIFTFSNFNGIPKIQSGQCNIPFSLARLQLPTAANVVSAVADGGTVPMTIVSPPCNPNNTAACEISCPIKTSPAISVTKHCSVHLVAEGGVVKVKVNFVGTVKNTSDAFPTILKDITVVDNKVGNISLLVNGVPTSQLQPGQEGTFSGSYFPNNLNGQQDVCPVNASFSDTVTVTAKDAISGQAVEMAAPATCGVCVDNSCPIP